MGSTRRGDHEAKELRRMRGRVPRDQGEDKEPEDENNGDWGRGEWADS